MSNKNILEQLVDAIRGTRKSEGNPYHDARGRFASGNGGKSAYGPIGGKHGRSARDANKSPEVRSLAKQWDADRRKYQAIADKTGAERKELTKKMKPLTGTEPAFAPLLKKYNIADKKWRIAQDKLGKMPFRPTWAPSDVE